MTAAFSRSFASAPRVGKANGDIVAARAVERRKLRRVTGAAAVI
jgi:hypothetical protein